MKDVESEFEVKDYIQNYLGDNKEVREFIKQFFDKRLKIQNKQRSSDFVEMKVSFYFLYYYLYIIIFMSVATYSCCFNEYSGLFLNLICWVDPTILINQLEFIKACIC